MSRRMTPALCLALVAAFCCLPADVAPSGRAERFPESVTPDLKLITGDCALFVTLRPADFVADELFAAILGKAPNQLEEELQVSAYGLERYTVAVLREGQVQIVRTKKAYDADKIRDKLPESRPAIPAKFEEEAEDAPRKPIIHQKKVGGKTIYYVGELFVGTHVWCPIDKHTFLQGNIDAVVTLLQSKAKPSAGMAEALTLASENSLVIGTDGKLLRILINRSIENGLRSRVQMSWVQVRFGEAEKAKGESDDVERMFDSDGFGLAWLPMKPLLASKFGILTLDVKKTYLLTARIALRDKDDLDDGERAVRTILYIGRQIAARWRMPAAGKDFEALMPLGAPLHEAIKDARIERRDNTLVTSIVLTPGPGLAKKVRDAMAEKKKREGLPDKKDKSQSEKVP